MSRGRIFRLCVFLCCVPLPRIALDPVGFSRDKVEEVHRAASEMASRLALSSHFSPTMVRLSASCALLALSALPGTLAGPLQLFQDGSNAVIRAGMRNILRLNETTIDRLLANEETPLEPHPYACAYSRSCRLRRGRDKLTPLVVGSRPHRRQLRGGARDGHRGQPLCNPAE